MAPEASIVVPTRARAGYLHVTLASIAPQARAAGDVEIMVAADGQDPGTRAVAARHGARCVALARPQGPNAARNAGIAATTGALVVLVDDDVEAPPGWLDALLRAARDTPDRAVFGGPIRPRLEGFSLPLCGREAPPVSALDLGPDDRDAEFAWSANLAIRREALDRVGPFDESLDIYGDEEDWLRRHRAAGGRVRYVAAAGLHHRRAGADARMGALARAAYRRGRHARRYDARKRTAPPLAAEARTLAGCVWHGVRRRCANGIFMTAHTAGRIAEALRPEPGAGPDFLSGESGTVGGRRGALLGIVDAGLDVAGTPARRRVAAAARRSPARRRVLVAGVDRPDVPGLMAEARAELARSRHEVDFAIGPAVAGLGKWANLNALLAAHPPAGHDWLLVLDDDVALPRGFLDGMLLLAERFSFRLAQPAHRRRSHAAWRVTRRRAGSLARRTQFVEIGPVTLLHADTFPALLPFPDLWMGWGLDLHWAALARERDWAMGVVDVLPVAHLLRPAGAAYPRERAVAEARDFLAARPYVPREEAQRTLAVHRAL